MYHDDVIKWKHFPRYWPFVRGIHRSPVNSPHKGQWRGALIFSLICVWINDWVNNREAGDLRRYRTCYDVIVKHFKLSSVRCRPFCSTGHQRLPVDMWMHHLAGQCVLRQEQIGCHYSDGISKSILLIVRFNIFIQISHKFGGLSPSTLKASIVKTVSQLKINISGSPMNIVRI